MGDLEEEERRKTKKKGKGDVVTNGGRLYFLSFFLSPSLSLLQK